MGNVFVSNLEMYLSQIGKCICIKMWKYFLSQIGKWICLKLTNLFMCLFKMAACSVWSVWSVYFVLGGCLLTNYVYNVISMWVSLPINAAGSFVWSGLQGACRLNHTKVNSALSLGILTNTGTGRRWKRRKLKKEKVWVMKKEI